MRGNSESEESEEQVVWEIVILIWQRPGIAPPLVFMHLSQSRVGDDDAILLPQWFQIHRNIMHPPDCIHGITIIEDVQTSMCSFHEDWINVIVKGSQRDASILFSLYIGHICNTCVIVASSW